MSAAVGLVVAGAGARGAYEAGALSVLVPELVDDGAAPSILVGTSAGALNVVGLAAQAHLGWARASAGLVDLWASVQLDQVIGVPAGLVETGARYTGQLLGLPVRLPSLFDTRRQRETLSALVDLDALHDNISNGPVDAVAVTATSAATGGTLVFVEKKPHVALPPFDAARDITYVATELTIEHVLASAAVPVAFRPVRVTTPKGWAGWYVDGGVRLNVPLKPALDLGADRLGVVATSPDAYPPATPVGGAQPDVFGVAALTLRSLLADRMVEDLRTLGTVNALLGDRAAVAGRRRVPFRFAGPPPGDPGAIGALASDVARTLLSGVGPLRHPDAWLLDRLVGGTSADRGELLSFLLFLPEFTVPAAELGAQHAGKVLSGGWRTELGAGADPT